MKFSLFLLIIVLSTIVCEAGVTGRASNNGGGGNSAAVKAAETSLPKSANTSGISTMGLIMIIMLVIMLGFAGYWLIICYPFFLKQHDATPYARVSAPSVTTTRTNSGEYIHPFPYLEDKKLEN